MEGGYTAQASQPTPNHNQTCYLSRRSRPAGRNHVDTTIYEVEESPGPGSALELRRWMALLTPEFELSPSSIHGCGDHSLTEPVTAAPRDVNGSSLSLAMISV